MYSDDANEELESIPDIGEKIASSVYQYIQSDQAKELINKLKSLGINMSYLGEEKENALFTNKKFVITGTLSTPRDEIKDMIESFGGQVVESVSKKTDYLLLGENPGSKYDKAKALGIKIINEEEFNEMIEEH